MIATIRLANTVSHIVNIVCVCVYSIVNYKASLVASHHNMHSIPRTYSFYDLKFCTL